MPLKSCPEHPDKDTMVPCLGCGRDFCRICNPPRGAGQYCPSCYEESLARFAGGPVGEGTVPDGEPVDGAAGTSAGAAEPWRLEATKAFSRLASILKAPWIWLGRKTKAASTRVGRRTKSAVNYVIGLPGRAFAYTGREIREHFPLKLSPTVRLEGAPPFGRAWPKLLGVGLSCIVLWVALAAVLRQRNPAISILVGALVALGTAWSFDSRYGPSVGVIAACACLVVLMTAELAAQLLYRAGVIGRLDMPTMTLQSLSEKGIFYRSYFKSLILFRLLPATALAFAVGLWPLSKRMAWRGFNAETSPEDGGE